MKPVGHQPISPRFSRHAPQTAKNGIAKLKRDFAQDAIDESRYLVLDLLRRIEAILPHEREELARLEKLRQWRDVA